jgi:glycosyltransferase involved in cell wall biosynthesis
MTQSKPVVVHVITRLIVGGAQLSVVGLCEALREHYDVRLIIGPEEGLEGSLRARAAESIPLTIVPTLRRDIDPRNDLAAVTTLRRTLRGLSPAIVHTHSSKAGILGRVAAMRRSVKLVHTIHGWGHTPDDSRLRRAMLIRAERLVARRTDALVAVSSDVRDEGLQCRIGHPDLYEVIPAFVVLRPADLDFDASRQRARRALGLEDADEIVGWVGRFVPQKDPDTLVRVLELILGSRTTARAVLIGDGPMRRDTERRLRKTGVGERVVFAGLKPDARALYAAFDVLLHPSLWEGQPLVIKEAIAERVPVVATLVTGTDDLVEEGRTGYLTRPGDGEGMAAHALAVLEGTGLRAPLAADVVAQVSARHGHELALTRHLALYKRLLAGATAAHGQS